MICDATVCANAGWTLVDFVSASLDGGAALLQLRAKDVPGAWLLDAARTAVARTRPAGAHLIINDRPDIAVLAGADGVHVGQDDLEPQAVRTVVGASAIVGQSTHTPEQLAAAIRAPVDYVAIGPVFDTGTKHTGYDALGLNGVRQAAAAATACRLPVVAIGGITLATAAEVLAAGAQSVAVISDLFTGGDPAARVRTYLARLPPH